MDRRADTVEKRDRQTYRQREDRQTDRWTDRQEAERAILTVIEVFIWIEGDPRHLRDVGPGKLGDQGGRWAWSPAACGSLIRDSPDLRTDDVGRSQAQ